MKDPVEHAALYQELINVTTEIKSLEPVLLSPDAPVITANSETGTVFTKTKLGADGTRYLFSYNYTASPVTAEFTLAQPAASIIDYDTGVSTAPDYQHDLLRRLPALPGARLSHQRFRSVADPHSKRDAVAAATATPTGSPTPAPTSTATRDPAPPTKTATATKTATVTPTATTTATATATADHDSTARPQRRQRNGNAHRDAHARRIVNHACEIEIRGSETWHQEFSQDLDSDQRQRGGGENHGNVG